eukprot:TRINITY_DN9775_c0_g1_i3.p1 TRINITY_DN9775_c0_g1~~TRINITY_DN9775_c0_g1_i3.p1  ORF type:complete len:366 (-),score=86.69 TRINITY_DN9775_c0_g1_i3:145-1242(-)
MPSKVILKHLAIHDCKDLRIGMSIKCVERITVDDVQDLYLECEEIKLSIASGTSPRPLAARLALLRDIQNKLVLSKDEQKDAITYSLDLGWEKLTQDHLDEVGQIAWKNLAFLNLAGVFSQLQPDKSQEQKDDFALFPLKGGHFGKLTKLNLAVNQLTSKDLEILASWRLVNLETLLLGGCHLSAQNIGSLKPAKWNALQVLDLTANRIGEAGVQILCSFSWTGTIKRLLLRNCQLKQEGVAEFCSSWKGDNLRELDLSQNFFGDEGVKSLMNSKFWMKLQTLGLAMNQITSEGAKCLIGEDAEAAVHWNDLERLDLCNNRLGDDGADVLSRSNCFHKLRLIELAYNGFQADRRDFSRKPRVSTT